MWEAFLDRITGGNADLQGYLQRFAGYALTGLTVFDMFPNTAHVETVIALSR